MIWFLDTSALVKRYIRESGSDWLRKEIKSHQVLIAQITPVELASALGRNLKQGKVSDFVFRQARRRFLLHIKENQYKIEQMTQLVVNQAMRLAYAYRLRAYDAVQLATALVSVNVGERDRMFFVTSDGNLETVAIAEGLQALNPSKH